MSARDNNNIIAFLTAGLRFHEILSIRQRTLALPLGLQPYNGVHQNCMVYTPYRGPVRFHGFWEQSQSVVFLSRCPSPDDNHAVVNSAQWAGAGSCRPTSGAAIA